jgi:hypothetical protein
MPTAAINTARRGPHCTPITTPTAKPGSGRRTTLTTTPAATATDDAAHITMGTKTTASAGANAVFYNIAWHGTTLTTTPAATATDDAACTTMGTTTTTSVNANAVFNNAVSNNIAATNNPAAAAVASSITEATTIDVITKPALEMKAVLPENSLNASPSPGKGQCVLKSTGNDPPYNHWLDLINECNGPVEISEVSRARVNKVFPIVYCTNTKNIDDEDNWAPCILSKIQKDQYQVLDTNEDLKLEKSSSLGG